MKKALIIFAVALASCRPTKIVTNTETIQHDSVFVEKVVTKYEAVNDTITIQSPCDSNGILLPFQQRIKVGQGELLLSNVNGQIKANLKLNKQENTAEIKYVYRNIYKTVYKEKTKGSSFFDRFILYVVAGALIITFVGFKLRRIIF
jgi:hypothetical protein